MYEHVERQDSDHPGTYRVVGVTDASVTLLHVADADGRRIHPGRTVSVSRTEYESLPTASNPDSRGSLGEMVTSLPTAIYWSLRGFSRSLASSPVRTLAALAAVVVGTFGAGLVPLPEPFLNGLYLGGILGLVLIGSGRV